jgi:Cys-tRNA(Pro)/Cys-tRNA(Cys) deacylase
VAKKVGMPPEEVFKTLVLRGEKKGVMVCVVPVELEVDLKKLAQAAGDKKVEMVPMKEILGLTGYIRGGVSPIGMKKKFPTYIDETCLSFERITVSSGTKGAQLLLSVAELLPFVDAKTASLTQPSL